MCCLLLSLANIVAQVQWVLKNAVNVLEKLFPWLQLRPPLTQVWKRVCKISDKFLPPTPLVVSHAMLVRQWLIPRWLLTYLQITASVSRKDSNLPLTHHHHYMESGGINFASNCGESYSVPFLSWSERWLYHSGDLSQGLDDLPCAFLCHMQVEFIPFY